MKSFISLLRCLRPVHVLLATALIASSSSAAHAQSSPGKESPPTAAQEAAAKTKAKAKRTTYPLYGEVVSISATTLVIKGGVDKPNRTFAILKETQFVNGDQPASFRDVIPGKWVGGSVKKLDSGNDEVLKINVGVKQKVPKTAAEKKP